MNDPQFFEAARKLSERAIKQSSNPQERMNFIAETLLARPLEEEQLTLLIRSKERFASHYKEHPEEAKQVLTNGAAPPDPGLDAVEVATWAMVANQFFNLDETLNK